MAARLDRGLELGVAGGDRNSDRQVARRGHDRGHGARGSHSGPMRATDLEDGSLGGSIDLERRPLRGRQRPSSAEQIIDRVVVTLWVVMEEDEPTDAARAGQRHGVLHRAVAPADLGGVASGVVLRVVHDHVGIGEELRVTRVGTPQPRQTATGKRRVVGLVVGGVDNGRAIGLDAETEGEGGVVQVLGPDGGVTELEHAFDQVVVAHLGVHLVQPDREVLVLHLPREHVVEGAPQSAPARTHPTGCRGRRGVRRTAARGCDPSGCDR